MNRDRVEKLIEKNRVVAIKADKTHANAEIDQLLIELGNDGAVIPFLAIFPGDGSDPITFDGPMTQQTVLDALEEAGPSPEPPVPEQASVADTAPAPRTRCSSRSFRPGVSLCSATQRHVRGAKGDAA